ncbi:hypothetical protein GHT06_008884 [Daphnia sinensis]|uniref:Uncharacterized protein n=1 Tax=Daphnia sinensis TaxID=1820382 RepID=A0AAD5LN62_9CRUS|nr:hypothetical protein GHT06_008884 [Daphnia sinensis]
MKDEDGTPIQVYRKTLAECSRDLETHAVNSPRDAKQLANAQFRSRLKSNLSSNGIWNLMYIIDDTQFIIRGRYNYGQHRILPQLAHIYEQVKDKPILPDMVDPKTIIQTIKDAEKDVNAHFKKFERNVEKKENEDTYNHQEKLTVYERALFVINDKDGISMRTGEFIVKRTLGTSHVVTLFP